MGGGDIKDEGKPDPLAQTKGAVEFRDKGNAIHRVTMNATHACPVWLHSAFHSFNITRLQSQCSRTRHQLEPCFKKMLFHCLFSLFTFRGSVVSLPSVMNVMRRIYSTTVLEYNLVFYIYIYICRFPFSATLDFHNIFSYNSFSYLPLFRLLSYIRPKAVHC